MRNKDADPAQDRAGRAAALAAFDRSVDGARAARTARYTVPSPEQPLHRDHDGIAPVVLRFDMEGIHLDLQVQPCGGHSALSGLVSGDFDHVEVHLRRPDRTLRLFVGADGRFDAADLSPGPLSLAVERPGHPLTVTEWFTTSVAQQQTL
ncbi:peptidase associated/transthyretin-like domain-containing protein [Nocardiopsis metallicus]|uniref:Uncharacterized protein n=1 Tax=Nocardiopsis metallicus TaxID=179819 RepID=A0A840WJI4_9ACTN|nr:carboxypeptidase-like regulatory domain-containing protein [Nocardiopsis metallicus]MBB5492035.1 hypothetical protein [Nocardiopsis metallicus]